MSTKVVHDDEKGNRSIPAIISETLYTKRKAILAVLAVLVVGFCAFAAYTVISEKKAKSLDEATAKLIEDWGEAKSAKDETALKAKEDEILASADELAKKGGMTPSAARARMLAADIRFSRKDWAASRDDYLAAASASREVYTAGLALFNAAVCEDELGNADAAFDLYGKAALTDSFAVKPRALFNQGRIEEQRMKNDAAIAIYETLVERFPDDSWALLAKSRIIALGIQ
jgi:tetratricopeptide (TPR) repeat protein